MAAQKYVIDNVTFNLREDGFNLDELEVLDEFAAKLSSSDNTIVGNFSSTDMKLFLQTVLEPANGKPLPDNFSFGKAKEETTMEVFKAFFLSRLGWRSRVIKKSTRGLNNISQKSRHSMKRQQKH